MRRVAAGLAFLVLALSSAFAGPRQHVGARSDWYSIHVGDRRVGWAERSSGPARIDGHDVLRIEYRVRLRLESGGTTHATQIERRKIFSAAPPHAFLRGFNDTRRGRRGKRVQVGPDASGRMVARVTTAGTSRTLAVPADLPTFDEEMGPAGRLGATRRAPGPLRWRTFDLSELEVREVHLAVRETYRTPTGATRHRGVQTTGEDADPVVYDARGSLVRTRLFGLLELRRTTMEAARRPLQAVDLLERTTATADRTLGRADLVRGLVLRARGPNVARLHGGPGQVVRHDPRDGSVTIRVGTAAGAQAVRATPAEIREALRETAAYPIHDRVVRALAQELAATRRTTREKVERLATFVQDFVLDTRDTEPLTVPEILTRQEGDCSEHALLFTALARAAGIPAREVSGFVYRGDDPPMFGWHAWAEVVIDGRWVPVDPMHGQLPADATHLREGPKDAAATLALAGARLEVLRVDRRPPPKEIPDPWDD